MVSPFEEGLHRGRGVRDKDLRTRLPAAVATRFHIGPAAGSDVVLATVVWQVRDAIRRSGLKEREQALLAAAYNLERDPRYTEVPVLKDRLLVFGAECGRSIDTLNRLLGQSRRKVVRVLKNGPFARPPAGRIAWEAEQEADYRTRFIGPPEYRRLGPEKFTEAVATLDRAALAEAVMREKVHLAIAATGTMVLRKTSDFGVVACVFTSVDLLGEFQRAVGAPASDRMVTAVGGKVVRLLRQDGTVGLAVNPVGGAGRSWTADELVAL